MKRIPFFMLMLLLIVAGAATAQGFGPQGPGNGPQGPGGMRGPGADLTEEQRAELHELIESLRQAGASRDEIRKAVADLFAE